MKRWKIINKLKTPSSKLKTKDIIKVLLKNRGLITQKQVKEFLTPSIPYKLEARTLGIKTGKLRKAVKRIKKAIDKQESIIVYSDFDADGVSGAAILWETLSSLGAKVMPYIPDRVKEGYGLSQKGIDKVLKDYGASLIITVDQGITARKKIDYAKKLGIEVIVTDHHVPPKKLPNALAIVHTASLSGSGVAWVLARHLQDTSKRAKEPHREWAKALSRCEGIGERQAITPRMVGRAGKTDHLALVAIGTIADLIPLIGPSRSLVKYGLNQLNKTQRIGLNALFKEAGLEKGKIGTYEVGFMIAPRLNAMGRLVHAMDSLRLLCTHDRVRAEFLAQKLGQTNRERQKLMEETVKHAKELLEANRVTNFLFRKKNNDQRELALLSSDNRLKSVTPNLIFLSHSSYHEGIIGLVAGKLVEQFYRPAIVVSKGEIYSKASARSIDGFNVVEAIRTCSDLLVDCGGHPMAAGFTVETKYLEKVQKKLEQLAAREIPQEKLTKTLKIDYEIALSDISFALYQKIAQFEPFGIGNPEPVFATRNVMVEDARVVGSEGKHLKLSVETPGVEKKAIDAIAFGMGHLFPKLSSDKSIDIAYTILLDQWNNKKRLQLKIKDIKIKK